MPPHLLQLKRNLKFIKDVFQFTRETIQTRRIPDWQLQKVKDNPLELRMYLALKQRGYKVKTHYMTLGYEVDMVIKKYRIAIECDGKKYHSSEEQKRRDLKKSAVLSRNGWKVKRFKSKDIFTRIDWCIEQVEKAIQERKRRYFF